MILYIIKGRGGTGGVVKGGVSGQIQKALVTVSFPLVCVN